MATAADNILLAFYTLLWVISFILYHYQNRHIDGGSAVMASYIVYCFFSFITLNDEFFDITYEHLCHKSYLVNMTGTSYRIKETKKIIEKK
jgi:hypothetical protein